jgi:hypothetical protein
MLFNLRQECQFDQANYILTKLPRDSSEDKKLSDSSIACVTPETSEKLIQHGLENKNSLVKIKFNQTLFPTY